MHGCVLLKTNTIIFPHHLKLSINIVFKWFEYSLYGCTIIYSIIPLIHLKYFHFVPIVNNSVMNVFVYKPQSRFLIPSFEWILRCGVTVSIGVDILEGLENSKYSILYRIFVSGYVPSIFKRNIFKNCGNFCSFFNFSFA